MNRAFQSTVRWTKLKFKNNWNFHAFTIHIDAIGLLDGLVKLFNSVNLQSCHAEWSLTWLPIEIFTAPLKFSISCLTKSGPKSQNLEMILNGKYLSEIFLRIIAIIKLETFRVFTFVFFYKSDLKRMTTQLICQRVKLIM